MDPEIAKRIDALRIAAAERRAQRETDVLARLDSLLEADLADGEHEGARRTLRLQAEIAGLIGRARA